MGTSYKPPDKTYEKPYVGVAARGDGKPMEVGGVTVRILAAAFDKLQTYINECPHEVGGKARVLRKSDHFLITDVVILHQEAGAVHTTIEGEDDARFIEEVVLAHNDTPGNWRCWWHSHVNMEAYFSVHEDVPTIHKMKEQLPDLPWQVSIVGNKRGEFRVRYDLYEPHRLVIDNLGLEIVFGQSESVAVIVREELKSHIRPPLVSTGKVRFIGPGRKGKRASKGYLDRIFDKITGQEEVELEDESGSEEAPTTDATVPTLEQFERVPYQAKGKIVAVWQSLLQKVASANCLSAYQITDEMKDPFRTYTISKWLLSGGSVAFVTDGLTLWQALTAATTLAARKSGSASEAAAEQNVPAEKTADATAPSGNDATETPPPATSPETLPKATNAEPASPRHHLYELTLEEYDALTTETERSVVIEAWLGRFDEIVCVERVSEQDILDGLDYNACYRLTAIRDRWSHPGIHTVQEGDGKVAYDTLRIAEAMLRKKMVLDEKNTLLKEMNALPTMGQKDKLLDEWCDEIRGMNESLGLDPETVMDLIGLNPRKCGAVTVQLLRGKKSGRQINGLTNDLAALYLAAMSMLYVENVKQDTAVEQDVPATTVSDAPTAVAETGSGEKAEREKGAHE